MELIHLKQNKVGDKRKIKKIPVRDIKIFVTTI